MSTFAKKIDKLLQVEIDQVVKLLAEKYKFDDQEAREFLKSSPKPKNKTKRPVSAYIRFCNSKRPELKESAPELSSSEVLTELGRLWKGLDDTARKPFIESYEKEMADYKSR